MGNTNLKLLAQKAKNRLKTVGETLEKEDKVMALSSQRYAIIATRVKIEDDPLFNKVNRILTKNPDCYNPLGELIDHSVFDSLSPSAQQKYILNLSERFNKIKLKLLA